MRQENRRIDRRSVLIGGAAGLLATAGVSAGAKRARAADAGEVVVSSWGGNFQAGQREESGAGTPRAQGGAHGGERAQSAQASEGSRRTRDGEEHEVDARGGSAASADRTRGGLAGERPLSEEQRLAYEQWLRRIPDDPGGLLRRKFALEYRTRSGRSPSRSDAW